MIVDNILPKYHNNTVSLQSKIHVVQRPAAPPRAPPASGYLSGFLGTSPYILLFIPLCHDQPKLTHFNQMHGFQIGHLLYID